MIPPTSIDGTDITGATIDGTDVQEITVDGQTVFTAAPQINLPVAYSNLVAWYPFDSATYGGSNTDDVTAILGGSGDDTAYDGTVNGATYQSSGGRTDINAGASSGYYEFTADNDEIIIPHEHQTSNFTYTMWIRNVNGGTDNLFGNRDGSNDTNFLYADNSFYRPHTGNGGFGQFDTQTAPSTNSTWQHIAWVYDGSNRIYIDGVEDANSPGSNTGNTIVNTDFTLTGPDSGENGIICDIDDFRAYNTALTQTQIEQIVQNTQDPNNPVYP